METGIRAGPEAGSGVAWLAMGAGALTAGLGVAAIISWHAHWPHLTSFGLGLAPMQYCSAMGMTLAGLALMATQWRRAWLVVVVLAGVVMVMGAANLISYGFHVDMAIQRLLVGHVDSEARVMGPITALDLLVISFGLLVASFPRFPQRPAVLILMGVIALGIGIYALLGYAWGTTTPYGWGELTRMSPTAALASIAMGAGLTSLGWRAELREQPEQLSVAQLRRSILVYTTGSVMLIVVLAAVLAVLPIYHQLRLAQDARLQEIAMVRSAAIGQYSLRAQTIADQVSSRTPSRELLEQYDAGQLSAEELAARSRVSLQDAVASSDELVGVMRLDRSDKVLISVGLALPEDRWPESIRKGKPDLAVEMVQLNHKYFLITRNEIQKPGGGKALGADIVLIKADSPHRILADRSDLGKTGKVALAVRERDGVKLLYATGGDGSFEVETASPLVARLVRQAAGRHQTMTTSDVYSTRNHLRFARPVPNSPWVVVVSMATSELYEKVDQQLTLIIAGVTLLALLGAMGMLLVLRPLTGGIVLRAGALERKVEQATAALQHELHQRQRYEHALRESEERFDLAVRGADVGLWDWDLRTNDVYFSPRWKSMLGFGEDELPNNFETWASRLHPEDRKRAMKALEDYHQGVLPTYELEHRLRHKDGSYRWILARGIALRDKEGKPYRMAGSNQDITDRKRDEQQLHETAEALKRSNQELEQFAYIASHDLQEPLRKVIAFGDMLEKALGEKLDEDSRKYLERMQNGAARLQSLIQDLLAYSRVTSSAQTYERVDLNTVVAEVLDDLQMSLQETGATVTVGQLPVLIASPTQMRQLFQNLIANGVKFHRPDVPPEVRIESETMPAREGSPAYCRISVTDNGIGFEPSQVDRIFKPFQRLHERGRYPGTGIGLSLSQKIVERHGGQITAASEPEVGSTFILTLPLTQPTKQGDTPDE